MLIENESTRVPQYILNRQARVAVAVVERHREVPVVAPFVETLVPRATKFIEGYEALSVAKARRTEDLRAARAQVSDLFRATSGWLGLLQRDVDGFDSRGVNSRSTSAVDVLSDAERVIEMMGSRTATLPYAQRALSDLRPMVEDTAATHERGQRTRIEVQQLQAEVREAAEALQDELVALRRTLRAALGSGHLDYQRLRTPRSRMAEGDALEQQQEGQTESDPLADADAERGPSPAPTNGHASKLRDGLELPDGVTR